MLPMRQLWLLCWRGEIVRGRHRACEPLASRYLTRYSSEFVELAELGACQEFSPLGPCVHIYRAIRPHCAADEYGVALARDHHAGATFACTRDAPAKIPWARRIY